MTNPSRAKDPKLRLLTSSSSVFSSSSFPQTDTSSSEDEDFQNFVSSDDYGLLITRNVSSKDLKGTEEPSQQPPPKSCELQFCADAPFPEVHPHARAPLVLRDVQKLGGGGSGISVFSATHPELGDLVMKHGDYKDLKELFALATIEEQLKIRGGGCRRQQNPCNDGDLNDGSTSSCSSTLSCSTSRTATTVSSLSSSSSSAAATAAADMSQRLPEFRMIYMSPHHFRRRGVEIWGTLKALMQTWSVYNLSGLGDQDHFDKSSHNEPIPTSSQRYAKELMELSRSERKKGFLPRRPPTPITRNSQLFLGRSIRLYEGSEDQLSFELDTNRESLALIFPKSSTEFIDTNTVKLKGDSYTALKSIVKVLLPIMTDKLFKFTLGQKTIGGGNGTKQAQTGNLLLYQGNLQGTLLDTLITQFIQVIRDLQELTLPEEMNVVEQVREEVEHLEETNSAANTVSVLADSFAGNAVKKNFHTEKGRIRLLLSYGRRFREYHRQHQQLQQQQQLLEGEVFVPIEPNDDWLVLAPEEELPVKHLGNLLRSGALIGDTFENASMESLELHSHLWRNILKRAVMDPPSRTNTTSATDESSLPVSLRRIWTCGLTDAGIHNLFLSEDKLWFFDLGEPQLMSIPGFLTKFMFSFFHTLGMEEEEGPDGLTTWVRRFVPSTKNSNKLELTKETIELLPKAYNAYEICLDRLINEVFEGDNYLRWLLLQYTTLQLLSDAAFCLQRWQFKGGGRPRSRANHNAIQDIEKWLWRALWDIYIACDINKQESWLRFGVEHPNCDGDD